jgi:hypothetical protein
MFEDRVHAIGTSIENDTMCFDMLPDELLQLIVEHVDCGCAWLFSLVNKKLFLLVSRHFMHIKNLSERATAKVDSILEAKDHMKVSLGDGVTVKDIRKFLTSPYHMNDTLMYYFTKSVTAGRSQIHGMPSLHVCDSFFFQRLLKDGVYQVERETSLHNWFTNTNLDNLEYVFFIFFSNGGWGLVVVNNYQGRIDLVPPRVGMGMEYVQHTIRFMRANYLKVYGETCERTWEVNTIIRNSAFAGDGAFVICTIDRFSSRLPQTHTPADMTRYRRHIVSALEVRASFPDCCWDRDGTFRTECWLGVEAKRKAAADAWDSRYMMWPLPM